MGWRFHSYEYHRSRVLPLLLLAQVVASPAHADAAGPPNTDLPADLIVLRTPASPAFVALGVSPTEVQRPTTPAAFASDLVSSFRGQSNSLVLPQGFALEVAPYWLAPRYDLTYTEYAKEGWQSLYRNATLSIATTATPPSAPAAAGSAVADSGALASTMTPGTDLAVGVRTTLFHPGLDAEQLECVEVIHQRLGAAALVDAVEVDKQARERAAKRWAAEHAGAAPPIKPTKPSFAKPVAAPAAPSPPDETSKNFDLEYKTFMLLDAKYRTDLEQYNAQTTEYTKYEREVAVAAANLPGYNDLIKAMSVNVRKDAEERAKAETVTAIEPEYQKCVQRITARGTGISVDAASALVWSFPSTRFENGDFKRAMAWLTAGWSNDNGSAILLVRYVGSEDTSAKLKSGYDIGGRVIYAADRFGISAEAVGRKSDEWASRYAGTFDYRVDGKTWVTLTVGKDYGKGSEGGLIATVGLQFNVGEPQEKLKPLAQQVK